MKKLGIVVFTVLSTFPVFAENATTLDTVYVYDQRDTSDEYIRLGSDITIVDSKELEKHHYSSVEDAIRNIPGVEIKTPGYRGIEFGNAYTGPTIAINGDNRVAFAVDGRRLGSVAVTSNMNERTKGSISMLPNPENIERIEVIRGMAAMTYGSDISGGVINVITKRPTKKTTTFELARGSWGRQKYSLTTSGIYKTVGYQLSLTKNKGGDTKYKDHYLNRVVKFLNTAYDEDSAFLKIKKDISDKKNWELNYFYQNEFAGYPIFAPDYQWKNQVEHYLSTGEEIEGVSKPNNRWHRWWYYYGDALMGSYSKTRYQNINLKYQYDDQNGISNYIRVYYDDAKYYMHRFRVKNNLKGFEKLDISSHRENSQGIDWAGGKKLRKNDYLYFGANIQKSNYKRLLTATNRSYTHIERDFFSAFLQDKIDVSSKFQVIPGLRYQYWGKSKKNGITNAQSDGKFTFGVFSQYKMNSTWSFDLSWAQIYNAPYAADIENQEKHTPDKPLEAETGNMYSLGVNYQPSNKLQIQGRYTLTDMKNSIGRYKVWVEELGDYEPTSTNIALKKKSLSLQANYRWSDRWKVKAFYSYAITDKQLTGLSSSYTSYDNLYNSYKYTNKYGIGVDYSLNNWSAGIDLTYYSGLDPRFFSDKHFSVVNAYLNYKVDNNLSAYLTVNNIFDEAYETRANSTYGIGTFPMESSNFLVGMKYRC